MKTTILIILIALSTNIFSQSFSKKYITYKSRFLEEYMTKTENKNEKGNFIPIEYITTQGQIQTADETWYLGFYIGVLATEYKLKQNDNDLKGLEQTKIDLNNILGTIDRLDSLAETYWGKPAKLDGFFIREDYFKDPEPMSQDQVWSLYYGFRLIKKFVDDPEIIEHTKQITKRLLHGLHPIVKIGKKKNKHKWCVVDPNLKQVQKRIDLTATKYLFAKTASIIVDSNLYLKGSRNFFTRFSAYAGRWGLYHRLLFKKKDHMYNTYGITSLTVTCNPNKAMKFSTKMERIATKYFPNGTFAHFPLTAGLLYYQKVPHPKEFYTKILDSAPMKGPNSNDANGWNTYSLIACPWHENIKGTFNGLDYLLLHNLVKLYYYNDERTN